MNNHSLILILLLFCLNIAATIGWGVFMLRISGIRKEMPDTPHLLFYSGIAGIIVLGDIILFSGLLGYLVKGILFFIFFLGVAFGVLSLYDRKIMSRIIGFDTKDCTKFGKKGHLSFLFLWLCLPFVIIIFLHDLVPDVSGDAYLYHITVPRYYALEGKIETLPISFCYNYPLQIEMYFLAGLRWGQEQSGVMMNFAILGLTCLGIFLLCRHLDTEINGGFSIFLFLSLPIVLKWAPTSMVDLSTAPFLLGSLIALLNRKKNKRKTWVLLAGFCAGGAVAVKLFLGIAVFLLIPIVMSISFIFREYYLSPEDSSDRFAFLSWAILFDVLKNLAIYFSGAAILLLPWMLKNAVMTYNPLFPFALRLFPTRPDLISSALTLHTMHGIPKYPGMSYLLKSVWGSFSLLSWDGNWIIISAMVMTPLFCFFSLKRGKRQLFWGFLFLIVVFILYYGTNAQVRWFQGFFPFLVIAFSIMVEDITRRIPQKRKLILSFLILLAYINAGWYYYLQLNETHLLPWTGFTNKTLNAYLKDKDRFKEASFLNNHLPENAKVLLYDMEINSTARWMERRFYQAGEEIFKRWRDDQADIDTILEGLKNMKITHIAGFRSGNDPIFIRLNEEFLEETARESSYTLYQLKYP